MARNSLKDANKIFTKDLDLRFNPHPVTGDIPILTDEVAIKRRLKNLIFTFHYDKRFHPEIGSDAIKMLFENISPITAIHLKNSIIDIIRNYEPMVQVEEVVVVPHPDDNAYKSDIKFYIINTEELLTLEVILEQLR